MGRKKFIDKKNSATFQLFARDSSSCDPSAALPASADADCVFVRVDNNAHYSAPMTFAEEEDGENGGRRYVAGDEVLDPSSIFADAPEGSDEDEGSRTRPEAAPLPESVRREILELGLPDDGYNYLAHLREIRKSGAGSNYYESSKAKLESVPLDVKAYDASRLRIKPEAADDSAHSMYNVAAKTVAAKTEKVVDPDVVRLLDDSDLSRFGSDVDELEEDFVAMANCPEEAGEDGGSGSKSEEEDAMPQREKAFFWEEGDKPRQRRPLDEQFDLLMLHEYGDDSESDDDYDGENKGNGSVPPEPNHALEELPEAELDMEETYRAPGSGADITLKCAEYARMYDREDHGTEDVVVLEESSDESEVWDCETIVSTYSNLDNHPGRIGAPGKPNRKRHAPELASAASGEKNKIIALRGKEMLPVDFLPRGRRTPSERERKAATAAPDLLKRKPDESKEEKKERKAAVKEARREARHAKKQLKELYKCESQLAQKVAAVSGPSSIHLM